MVSEMKAYFFKQEEGQTMRQYTGFLCDFAHTTQLGYNQSRLKNHQERAGGPPKPRAGFPGLLGDVTSM